MTCSDFCTFLSARGQLPQGGPPGAEATGNRVGTVRASNPCQLHSDHPDHPNGPSLLQDSAVWKRFDILEVKLQQLEDARFHEFETVDVVFCRSRVASSLICNLSRTK